MAVIVRCMVVVIGGRWVPSGVVGKEVVGG